MALTPVREAVATVRARPFFAFFVLLALVWTGVIGLMVFMMQLQPGFLRMAHFTEPHHRTHDLTYALLFATAGLGMLAQLRRPLGNVAGMSMALVPWLALVLVATVSGDPRVILSTERMSSRS